MGVSPDRFASHRASWGTVDAAVAPLSKALGRLGRRQELQIVVRGRSPAATHARPAAARARLYACEVIAPAKIAPPARRSDSRRIDAMRFCWRVRHRAGGARERDHSLMSAIEAMRDLSRARERRRACAAQGAPAAQGLAAACPWASLHGEEVPGRAAHERLPR